MSGNYDIVGIGNALVDTEIKVTDADLETLGIAKGLMTLCDEETQHRYKEQLSTHLVTANHACGGSAANSIFAAALMGSRASLACKVAKDEDGDLFLRELDSAGIQCSALSQTDKGSTGKCLVMITPDAERTLNTCLGVSELLTADELDLDVLESAEYLYIEGYLSTSATGSAAAKLMREEAEKQGLKITISLSDPGIVAHFEPQLREMLGDNADLIFCNEDEALAWTKTDSLEEAAEKLKTDTKRFTITRGAKGALCWDGEEEFIVESPSIIPVDANGAGDMFAGAALAALNKGLSLKEAAAFGCRGAAQVVSQFGPRLKHQQYLDLAKLL